MDSRGIFLALDLENGKRPCAEYGGGGDERCKYYSHGTLADEMARLSCTGSNSLAIFVLKLASLPRHGLVIAVSRRHEASA